MAKSRVLSPKDVVKVRRLPAKGDKLQVTVEVARVGRNAFDTADTITIRIPGFGTPVTVTAEYLLKDAPAADD